MLSSVNSRERMRVHRRLLAFLLLPAALSAQRSFSQWTKTIRCPAGHDYRDLRHDAGREEFCEVTEPGNLVLKDGPYKSWYNIGEAGDFGQYSMGREVGHWRDCDQFRHCRQQQFADIYPRERERPGFKPVVPVAFRDGKYVFDFASCRSTWVTQEGPDPINLNISGDDRYRCEISFIPQSVLEHGGDGGYICFIPFEVGKRELASIDLRKELHSLGLPQFCRAEDKHGDALMVRDGVWDVATTVDVECATATHDSAGTESLQIRLNRYASDEVRKAAASPSTFNSLLCLERVADPGISADNTGRALLTYRYRTNLPEGKKEARCVAERFGDLKKCP